MAALASDLDVRERGKLRKIVVQFIELRREYWGGLSFGGEGDQKFWVFPSLKN